jgi:hypothetical protein
MRARELADFTPIVEGIRYVRRDSRMLATMFVKCGLGLMGTNWVILPLLGERCFGSSDGLHASSGGMLGMSLLMGSRESARLGPLIGSLWAELRSRPLRLASSMAL